MTLASHIHHPKGPPAGPVEGATYEDSLRPRRDVAQFRRLERVAPLGYFAMGVGWIHVARVDGSPKQDRMLAIANGSDWTPQPLTLHRSDPLTGVCKLPHWFSTDYDHHMGLAVGDLNGTGYEDVVVAVFAGKDQAVSGGGVKVYRGGPAGLNPDPEWLARGFAATGVVLADLTGTGTLDVVVSCLSESGTIQAPEVDSSGHFRGRARLLENVSEQGSSETAFREHVIEHSAARGAGDVTVADVDLDGNLDVIFAGSRTTVLYGRPDLSSGNPWSDAPVWVSEEEHPFSFSAQAFSHPDFPEGQLVCSSRGLFSVSQLRGRGIDEIAPGLFVHLPTRGGTSEALQAMAGFDANRPELPAGLAVAHGPDGVPFIVAGFLDARSRDIRGAPIRLFPAASSRTTPFDEGGVQELGGGGLMAARVVVSPYTGGPTSVHQFRVSVDDREQVAVTLPRRPAEELLSVEVIGPDGRRVKHWVSRTSDGSTLCFSPPLKVDSEVVVSFRTAEDVEIAVTSSAAWPPAGASGVWRGRLVAVEPGCARPSDSPPASRERRAG